MIKKHFKILLTIFLTVFILSSSVKVFALRENRLTEKPGTVYSYELDNGLRLIIKEDHRHPIVAINALIDTGSANESNYSGCGISHFIEHMLFKGTKNLKAGEVHKLIKSLGGTINAYTSSEHTNYYLIVPKSGFDEALNLVSDIIQNSSFNKNEYLKEKEVILKEIYMTMDKPSRVALRNLWQKAFFVHPYKYPIIGYEELFLKLKREDLINFYNKVYIPDNIIISIAGDIRRQDAFDKVNKAFGSFKRKPRVIAPLSIKEPEQQGERFIVEYSDNRMGYVAMGFKSVDINSSDLYALDLLAIILGEGRSSRLNVNIKDEQKLAHSISAGNYTPRDNGLFAIRALIDGDKFDAFYNAVIDEIENIKINGVSEEELSKAKNIAISNSINYLQTVESQARDMAVSLLITNDACFTDKYIKRLNLVTREDINRTANLYLLRSRLTVSAVLPAGSKIEESLLSSKETAAKNIIKKVVLPNKITLLLKEDRAFPIVDVQAVFKGGVRLEDEKNNGLSNLMTSLFTCGTAKRAKLQISTELEARGASIGTFSQNNSFGISMNLLSNDINYGLELLSDILTNPAFLESEINHRKQLITAAIDSSKDDIFKEGFLLLRGNFFKNHPYRLDPLGTPESISKIQRSDILNFYRKTVRPSNLTLSIFGDIDCRQVEEDVKKYFANFKSAGCGRPKVTLSADNFHRKKIEVANRVNKEQALIMMGFTSPSVTDKDRYAFEVLNAVLNGGGSRLFYNLRDKQGLAYTLGTFSMSGFEPGCYVFYIATEESLINKSKESLLNEIKKLKKHSISAEEMKEAKKYLSGAYFIGLETNAALAFKCALDEMYGLGFNNYLRYEEKIEQVTLDDINAVINKYLNLDNYTTIILKPGGLED